MDQTSSPPSPSPIDLAPLDRVPESSWRALAAARVYFGHHSVGGNIIRGMTEIGAWCPAACPRIVDAAAPGAWDQPGFGHSRVGTNKDPESKIRGFEEAVAGGVGARADIAFFKFCYVDMRAGMDLRKVFESYTSTMDRLEAKHPRVRFAHATTPLTPLRGGLKVTIKKLLGRAPWEYEQNLAREDFNAMMRDRYGSSGRLLDLARLESTRPDGSPMSFRWKRRRCAAMVAAYSDDGSGHLGERGRRIVARDVLVWLAGLAAAGAGR